MKNIQHYVTLLENGSIFYKGTKIPVIVNSCSVFGFALELAVKDYYGLPLVISRQRGIDVITEVNGKRTFIEVKSNSSPLAIGVSRSSLMCYACFVDINKPLNRQKGYVINRSDFVDIGIKLNHIKTGTSNYRANNGKPSFNTCLKTQTVYNYSKGEYHGKKWFKLEDEYIEHGGISFRDWFTE